MALPWDIPWEAGFFKEAVWPFPGKQDSTSKDLLEQSQALHTLNPSLILPLKPGWFKTVPPPVELSECCQRAPSYSGGSNGNKRLSFPSDPDTCWGPTDSWAEDSNKEGTCPLVGLSVQFPATGGPKENQHFLERVRLVNPYSRTPSVTLRLLGTPHIHFPKCKPAQGPQTRKRVFVHLSPTRPHSTVPSAQGTFLL